jgi:hypothetical protein
MASTEYKLRKETKKVYSCTVCWLVSFVLYETALPRNLQNHTLCAPYQPPW